MKRLKFKRWFLSWFGIRVPYTREERKAAGYNSIDNSDLIDLLKLATKKAREDNGTKLVQCSATQNSQNQTV